MPRLSQIPSTRALTSLEIWEPVDLLKTVSNAETGERWALVKFHLGRQGFINEKHLKMIADTGSPFYQLFQQAAAAYYRYDFIAAAEAASRLLLEDASESLKGKTVVLLFRSHLEIAKRATSHSSKYSGNCQCG